MKENNTEVLKVLLEKVVLKVELINICKEENLVD
jgi:hypothetical protein